MAPAKIELRPGSGIDRGPLMEQQGHAIPWYVQEEFDDYLKCGRLEYGFFSRAARTAIMSGWWLSAISAAAFVPTAAPDGWPRVPRCWSTIFCPISRFAIGC